MIKNIKNFFLLVPIVMASSFGSNDDDLVNDGSAPPAMSSATAQAPTAEEARQFALRQHALACFHDEQRLNARKLFPKHPYQRIQRLLNGYVLKNERAERLIRVTQATRALAAMKVEAIKLHKAIRDRDIPTALRMINEGRYINAVLRCSDITGCPITIQGMEANPVLSPLMIAAIKDSPLIVNLLEAGANPFLTSGMGRSALMYGMNEFVVSEDKLLDHYFITLLRKGYTEKKAKALLRQVVNQKSDNGTPVIRYGKHQIGIKINHLKRYGVNLSATDIRGADILCRLLWLAKIANIEYEARHLAHNKACLKEAMETVMKDPAYKPKNVNVLLEGTTYSPFTVALELGYYDVAKYIIENGYRPNIGRDSNGNTDLMLCISAGQNDLAQILFDRGTDPRPKNHFGSTVMDMLTAYSPLTPHIRLRYMVMKWTENNNRSLPTIPEGTRERWAALIQGRGGDPLVLKEVLVTEGKYTEAEAIRIVWNLTNGEMDMSRHVGGGDHSSGGYSRVSASMGMSSLMESPSSGGVIAGRGRYGAATASGLIGSASAASGLTRTNAGNLRVLATASSAGGNLAFREAILRAAANRDSDDDSAYDTHGRPRGNIDPIDQAALEAGGVGNDEEGLERLGGGDTWDGSAAFESNRAPQRARRPRAVRFVDQLPAEGLARNDVISGSDDDAAGSATAATGGLRTRIQGVRSAEGEQDSNLLPGVRLVVENQRGSENDASDEAANDGDHIAADDADGNHAPGGSGNGNNAIG